MSLQDQVVIVTGITGNVGWGAALAFADAGAHVVAPLRGEASAEVQTRLPSDRHLLVPADISRPGQAEALRDAALQRFGRIDHAVASIGPWWQKGTVLEQSLEELRAVMNTSVESHFLLAKALLPSLRGDNASYTLVTGAAGERVVPGGSLLVMAVMAQFGLSRMLRAERREGDARVNELRIYSRIEKAPRPGVIPSHEAGRVFTAIARASVSGAVITYRRPEDADHLVIAEGL